MQAGARSTKSGITLGSARCPVNFVAGAVAAAGSDQSDAAALPYAMNIVSGADGAKGVILPTPAAAGHQVVVHNGEAVALLIYPQSGGTINGGTEDAAISVTAQSVELTCMDGTNWAASYTVS